MRVWVGLLIGVWASLCLGNVEAILARDHRPEIGEVVGQPWAELERHLGPIGPADRDERATFDVLAKVLESVRRKFPKHHRVFIGRDLEMLYDMHQLTVPPEEKKLGYLAQISRLVARDSHRNSLIEYLKKTGTDVEALARGEGEVLWLDTGARGSIYCNLLGHLYDHLGPQASPQTRRNLFSRIHPHLLQSKGNNTMGRYLDYLCAGTPASAREFFRDYIFFDELDPTLLDGVVSRDFYYRSKWLVNNIEHSPKWHPRIARIHQGQFEMAVNDRFTGEVNRKKHLILMARLARYVLGDRPWPGDSCPSALQVNVVTTADPGPN